MGERTCTDHGSLADLFEVGDGMVVEIDYGMLFLGPLVHHFLTIIWSDVLLAAAFDDLAQILRTFALDSETRLVRLTTWDLMAPDVDDKRVLGPAFSASLHDREGELVLCIHAISEATCDGIDEDDEDFWDAACEEDDWPEGG